jgi:hypothetical protein
MRGHGVRRTDDRGAGARRVAVCRRVGGGARPGHAVVELAFIITMLTMMSLAA